MEKGWSKKIMAGKAGDKNALPMISRNGTNNGFWVHSGHLGWANEDSVLKNHVDKRPIGSATSTFTGAMLYQKDVAGKYFPVYLFLL
jgi:hypothetical protein